MIPVVMINAPCKFCDYDPTLRITGSWLIELPTAAVSANQLQGNGKGRSGWRYRRIRDQFYEHIRARCIHIPTATEKRRAFFTRNYAGRSRPFDRDNLIAGFKPLRDCLTELGLLVDDNATWLEAHYAQKASDVNSISIVIETLLWS